MVINVRQSHPEWEGGLGGDEAKEMRCRAKRLSGRNVAEGVDGVDGIFGKPSQYLSHYGDSVSPGFMAC